MRLSNMRDRAFQVVGGLLGLIVAACDDGTVITRVARFPGYDLSLITARGTVPTVVHGTPLRGMTEGEVVASLRMPGGYPQGVRFVPVAADDADAFEGHRLVLVFNRSDAPDPHRDCRARRPLPTAAPGAEGFTLTMTLCGRDRPFATAHMEARRTRAGDAAGFGQVMVRLTQQLLAREP